MESHGEPGRIQVSEPTCRLIADAFTCIPRVDAWFVDAAIPTGDRAAGRRVTPSRRWW